MPSLPTRSIDTTKENPWPLGYYSRLFHGYVSKAPGAWIEAEVVSLKRYPRGAYLKLKDLDDEAFLPASSFVPEVIGKMDGLKEGAHVVFYAKPDFWVKRGEISMTLQDICEVGVGDMLARIEALKKQLASEGLFEAARKQVLPFLPRKVGLICGKNAQAKDDVIQNAKRRWPDTCFEVREVSVGNSPNTPREVMAALFELENTKGVDVIVITRGGGALEEVVIPFSDEALVRAVSEVTTPVVSAIGHETDAPIIDYVADFRASTPTDAAKNIVPSVIDELDIIGQLTLNANANIKNQLDRELQLITSLADRQVLRTTSALFEPHFVALNELTSLLDSAFEGILHEKIAEFEGINATLETLSPSLTLSRGYAIPLIDGKVVRSAINLKKGTDISLRFVDGSVIADIKEVKND